MCLGYSGYTRVTIRAHLGVLESTQAEVVLPSADRCFYNAVPYRHRAVGRGGEESPAPADCVTAVYVGGEYSESAL